MYSLTSDVRNALTPGAVPVDIKTTAAGMSDTELIDAIQQADSRINTYLPAGYTVPTQTIQDGDPAEPVEIAIAPFRYWSRDIAAYLATLTFKRNLDVSDDDPVRLRYVATMADLTLVAKGQLTLPPDADQSDDGAGEVSVYNQYEGTMFGLSDFGLAPAGSNPRYYEIRTHGGGF